MQLCLWTLQNITIGTDPFIKHIGLHTSGQDINSLLLLQNIGLHTSGQDIDSLYFCKISASILLEQDISPFLQSFKMLNIITDYKMGPPLSALFVKEPLYLPNQREPCKAINMHSRLPTEP